MQPWTFSIPKETIIPELGMLEPNPGKNIDLTEDRLS